MADTDTTDSAPEETESEQFREKYISGWLALTRNESVTRMIDALLDLPPYREFNKTELADEAGVSRQSVTRHVDLLVEVGVVEEVENTNPQRYRFDPESPVSEAILELEGAMNQVGPA